MVDYRLSAMCYFGWQWISRGNNLLYHPLRYVLFTFVYNGIWLRHCTFQWHTNQTFQTNTHSPISIHCFWITFIGYLKVKTWSQSSHLQCHVSPYYLLKDKLRLVRLSNVDLLGIPWYRHSFSEARCLYIMVYGWGIVLSSGTPMQHLKQTLTVQFLFPGNPSFTVPEDSIANSHKYLVICMYHTYYQVILFSAHYMFLNNLHRVL
jgi:hypothetical protein